MIAAKERIAMPTKMIVALVALLAGALMFPSGAVFARDCGTGGCRIPVSSPNGITMKGWIDLHRPDGETVRIKANQIVFIMTTAGTGSALRAQSKLQLVNGFVDVRESIEEVTQIIQLDESPVRYGT